MTEILIRGWEESDVAECGRILHDAFEDIANRHGFPKDFPSVEAAQGVITFVARTSWGVVAEREGQILGSNFLKEGDPVAAVGPISVDPGLQESGVGRLLMQAVIERGQRSSAVRLVQDAFNRTSMALYASLGFDVRDPLVLITGTPRSDASELDDETLIRRLEEPDLDACAELCRKVHGITRTHELRGVVHGLKAYVAVRDDRIVAYASSPSMWFVAHGVAETERDMRALLVGSAEASGEPLAFLLPTCQADLFRWALAEGLRIVKPMTLMTMGPYQEPTGSYFPSVGY